jgi:hypothetical protein
MSSAVICGYGVWSKELTNSKHIVLRERPRNRGISTEYVQFIVDNDAMVGIAEKPLLESTEARLVAALERVSHELTGDERERAGAAISDAVSFSGYLPSEYERWVDVSDSGIALMQWQTRKGGVLLLFAGDGEVTLSEQGAESNYLNSSEDLRVELESGRVVAAAIAKIYS